MESLKQQFAADMEKLKEEQKKAAETAAAAAAVAGPEQQKLKDHATRIRVLLDDVDNEFMTLRKQLEGAKDYNEAIKISKRIRDAKKVRYLCITGLMFEDFGKFC
jgi:hypothetical protein